MVDRAQAFWETNPNAAAEKQWTDDPIIAKEVYRRISRGESEAHWLTWLFGSRFAGMSFPRVLSAGCGTGDHELAMAKFGPAIGIIDAFDISSHSIDLARQKSKMQGALNLNFFQSNFDQAELGVKRYDLVLCSGSLHHVRELESFLQRVSRCLKPGGYLVANEYVGDCYNIYSEELLALVNKVLAALPNEALVHPDARLANPTYEMVMDRDPSEAVRSRLIPHFLRVFFQEVDQRPFGGNLLHLVYPFLKLEYLSMHDPLRQALFGMLMILEDEMAMSPATADFGFFICRKH